MKLHELITHRSKALNWAQSSVLDTRLDYEGRSVDLVSVAGLVLRPSQPTPFWLEPEQACIAPGRPASRATS